VHRQSGAIESNLDDRDTPACVGNLGAGLQTRRGDGAFSLARRSIQSGGEQVHLADPAVTAGTADSGRYRGRVAAALQNVRG